MDKETIAKAIKELREGNAKRKFPQTVDLVVNLKELNLKKPDEQVDVYVTLPAGIGKQRTVCGLVGPELADDSKTEFDHTLTLGDFDKLTKKDIKKLTESYDFFVAQANIMPKVAAAFGRVFGPRNKMPNPKAGCVVPPKANLTQVKERLASTIRLKAKTAMIVQGPVGREDMSDEDLIENIMHTYTTLVHGLIKEENNVKDVSIKFTMSKPVQVQ